MVEIEGWIEYQCNSLPHFTKPVVFVLLSSILPTSFSDA